MKSKDKMNEGITLVALVITIIILLILATISIQSLTHTGLFENANKAKLETKRSQNLKQNREKIIKIFSLFCFKIHNNSL